MIHIHWPIFHPSFRQKALKLLSKSDTKGFSLAEILLTIGIMALVATFTISKVLQPPDASQNKRYTAIAKDTAFMVMSAYERYRLNNGSIPSTVSFSDLTPYMNYVRRDTSTLVDEFYTGISRSCSAFYCLKLHNGAILRYAGNFNGTNTTNGIYFSLDPDGIDSGTTNGPGKALEIWLYYDGRIATRGTLPSTVTYSGGSVTINPLADPPWFTGF